MKKNDFNNLVKSVRQAGKIKSGKLSPSRRFEFTPLDIKMIRAKLRKSQSEFALMIWCQHIYFTKLGARKASPRWTGQSSFKNRFRESTGCCQSLNKLAFFPVEKCETDILFHH